MSNITVPYSVNRIDGHSSSYSKGNYTFTTTINLPKVQPTYLWFQHADQSADIYVDNVKVTTHWGGYNAFFTDISEYVHAGENEIKVILCNTTRNILAPYSADFNFNATLGKVKVITSPVMPDMFYGYDGFHITATNVSSAAATLTIKTSVPVGATVVCKIDDDDSNYHFYDEKPSTGEEMSFITTITNPTLWNGKINPHLYDVTLEIYKNGDLYHRFQRGYGIRYYSYVYNYTLPNNETYTGFLLNGSPYLLRGVCMHDDLEEKANALDDDDYTQEFAMINEVGCNFIRLAHYPHPKEVYDWCDRLGIIVQTEVPLVNNIKSTQPEDYYTHLEGQYYDMVTQHYNHPCIMFWGLGNEFNAQMDSDGGAFACTKLEHFRDIIKKYDTERMVGCVLNASSSNPRSTVGGADMDWYGCNIYVGWYSNTSSNNPTSQLNTRLNNVPDRPIAYSEYGCGGTQHCHSENYMSTTTRGNHERHDIEYQMWLHEGHIAAIKNFPQLLFTSEWQFFDIAVSNRNEGYTVCLDGENSYTDDELRRLNNKGLIERDHRTKKDTFYLYKAWWNQTDKFVHICGKDYEKYEDRVIKCYTNDGDSLTLYVNDTEIETVNVTNNIATFTAMDFDPGDEIKVVSNSTNDIFNIPLNYLTFNIKSSGNIIWKKRGYSATARTISYSKNGGTWTNITSTTSGVSIPVVIGDKVRFKGNNSAYSTSDTATYANSFGGTATFDVYGNIMSLIGGDNFSNLTTLSSSYTFAYLFYNCTGLLSAENLILPATTLSNSCYYSMFQGCTNLTTAPELPATILVNYCYYGMFWNCTSLTTAPELPATTMREGCYATMFYKCTSLTTAPELPATTLADYCYQSMFEGCTSLTTAPELPATTLTDYCYSGMFNGCTSLTTAPELPATTLVNRCYYYMFKDCTNLNYIKCLATNISATYCTLEWTDGVAAIGTFVKNPNMSSWTTGVSGIPTGWVVEDYDPYKDGYLTFDIKSDGNITWKMGSSSATAKTISYSKNDGEWTDITSTTSGVSIPVVTGDKVRFKGSNSAYSTSDSYVYANSFGGTSTFDAYGNIMSLIGGDNFSNLTTLSSSYTFEGLFYNCTGLSSAKNLVLPATTLTLDCYQYMFSGCTGLTTAPELPATTLLGYCYQFMFSGCTGLTTAPELPATTLANGCYQYMFSGCTGLTTAPELPATIVPRHAYGYMFNGCTGLTTAPELPATTLLGYCYQSMFNGCTGLTTAPELPATTLATNCYQYMFSGCTDLTTAPELPATTLANNCYGYMFYGCTNLNYIKCLATDISATYCTTGWVDGVAATGTFVKNPNMSSWTTGTSGIPSGWVVEDDYESEYLTFDVKSDGNITWKISNSSATAKTITYSKNGGEWTNITSTTEGVSIPVTTGDKVKIKSNNNTFSSSSYSYNYFGGTATFDAYGNIMSLFYGDDFLNKFTFPASTSSTSNLFLGCTGLLSAEHLILPATTLPQYCYDGMFGGCTNLTTAPELPATTLTNSCYYQMFYNCTSLNYIKCLATDMSATDCISDWTYNVCPIGTFVKDPNATWSIGASGIPNGWNGNCDYETYYLTFDVKSSGNITWKASNANNTKTISYLKNGGTWTSITSTTSGVSISVTTGDKVFFKGYNSTYGSSSYYNSFGGSATFDVYGNVMSLSNDGVNFDTYTSVYSYSFRNLFANCTGLVSAENLYISATSLSSYCYQSMFHGCTSLTTAPVLPATTLASYCYYSMFNGCTSLTTAPVLPATTLASNCYNMMFSGCTNLTTAPELPATTLAENCYNYMFQSCNGLTTAPVLPATTLAQGCYTGMFFNCRNINYVKCLATNISATNCTTNWLAYVSSTGTFVKNPNMSSWPTGVSGIPTGWTTENDYSMCYLTLAATSSGYIQFGTTSSTYKKTIYYSKNGGNWTEYQSTIASSTGIKVKSGDIVRIKGNNTTYSNGSIYCYIGYESGNSITHASFRVYGNIMSLIYGDDFIDKNTLTENYTFNGFFSNMYNESECDLITSIENLILPATTLTQGCYKLMFKNCKHITTLPELPSTTLAHSCYQSMFQGCTSLTTAPVLPATTLASYCYSYMFNCCTSLNYIKCLATNISATNCTTNWVNGVSATGTFVKDPSMTSWPTGTDGIPSGWTVVDNT